jgi:hypothetical protein
MLKRLLVAMLIFGMLTITPALVSARPGPAPTQAGKAGKKGGERHPKIRQAIRALQAAKDDLEDASHDFGGHRVEALEAVNNALKQLQQALEADKK